MVVRTSRPDFDRHCHPSRPTLGAEQHTASKAIFDDHPAWIEPAFTGELGELAAMNNELSVTVMARLIDGEQALIGPSDHLGAIQAHAVGRSARITRSRARRRVRQLVIGQHGRDRILAAAGAADGERRARKHRAEPASPQPWKNVNAPQLNPSSA